MKGYRKKDAEDNAWNKWTKDLEFIENGNVGQQIIQVLKRIERFVLFPRKNNQELWVKSEAYSGPSRTSPMGRFCGNS